MNRIIKPEDSIKISKEFREQGKRIVLVGGCFDILHLGHIKFLESAKKLGDCLFVLLENDESVLRLKGKDRPINNQTERAQDLSSLSIVDYVVLLSPMKTA